MNLQGGTSPRIMCTQKLVYGVSVKVLPPTPSSSLIGLRIEVKDGSWVETLEVNSALKTEQDGSVLFWTARKKAGTYEVTVTHPTQSAGSDLIIEQDGSLWFLTAADRAGTYEVSVTHPTLSAEQKKTAVVTHGDSCHVDGTSLEFRLQ